MLFQDLNGNFQYGHSIIPTGSNFQSRLPAIHEDRYLHSVPDINLECDETINWDEFEPCCIYSSSRSRKFNKYEEERMETALVEESSDFYHDYPPPNSPVKGLEQEQPVILLQNNYVNGLLQIWRDSQKSDIQESCENDDSLSLPSEEQSSQEIITSSDDQSDDNYDDEMATERDVYDRVNFDVAVNAEGSMSVHFPATTEQEQNMPVSQSSSRSTSPTAMEMLLQFRQNIGNLRSFSPIIVRSPSPLDSRSSSPRFLRSPSPLDFLEHSMSSLPFDSSSELVFYEDRYILRSISPVSTSSVDHLVPDVNVDFQHTVSDSEEFPSFRTYSERRIQNSCEDQVVPEFIEE